MLYFLGFVPHCTILHGSSSGSTTGCKCQWCHCNLLPDWEARYNTRGLHFHAHKSILWSSATKLNAACYCQAGRGLGIPQITPDTMVAYLVGARGQMPWMPAWETMLHHLHAMPSSLDHLGWKPRESGRQHLVPRPQAAALSMPSATVLKRELLVALCAHLQYEAFVLTPFRIETNDF